ncbi:uncharacterized protein LOC111710287 isoform X1 [Eurytemora carolleeae]|uniref:uncharacterized protein LOC111710287 isoform X1 n=1 Tax=Eurytemora carolleeae TaxID=1294199 RepID=UPI000C771389|nr:uncharacterized protein LOC111710287 isoform X1 [Eurytemora carolleeae]|eukprot:XP_023340104.1 uncharacterized protein LOC111710287 isoform X1 [Eurytemora affinis]
MSWLTLIVDGLYLDRYVSRTSYAVVSFVKNDLTRVDVQGICAGQGDRKPRFSGYTDTQSSQSYTQNAVSRPPSSLVLCSPPGLLCGG